MLLFPRHNFEIRCLPGQYEVSEVEKAGVLGHSDEEADHCLHEEVWDQRNHGRKDRETETKDVEHRQGRLMVRSCRRKIRTGERLIP